MRGANWPQNICSICVATLDQMCLFRKTVIDNQILIEQQYGPVVLTGPVPQQPTSFISESIIVLDNHAADKYPVEAEKPVEEEILIEIPVPQQESAPSPIKTIQVIPRRSTRSVAVTQSTAKPEEGRETELNEDLQIESSHQEETPSSEDEVDGLSFADRETVKYKDVDETISSFMTLNCTLCPATDFETFTKLRYHYSKIHSCKGFVLCCDVKHLRRAKLFQHIQYHMNPETFKCETCGKRCKNASNLKTHIQMIHSTEEQKRHECPDCNQKFGTLGQFKQHMLRHSEDKTFTCETCHKCFPGRINLISHIRIVHEKRRQHVCEFCPRSFTAKVLWENHLAKDHPNETGMASKRVQCQHCDKSFANQISLRKHLSRVNITGEKFPCPHCDHASPNKLALRGHIDRNHNPKREPLVCSICEKHFKTSTTLSEHMAQHTGLSLYTCSFCPKTFNSNANRYSHQKKRHPKEWAAKNNKTE